MQGRGDLAGGNLGILLGRDVREGLDGLLDHYRPGCRLWPDPEASATRLRLAAALGDGSSLPLQDQTNGIRSNAGGHTVRGPTQATHREAGNAYRPQSASAAWAGQLGDTMGRQRQ